MLLSTPAFADGKAGAMTGLIDLGYAYSDLDDFNVDRNAFYANGTFHRRLDGNWNVQGTFGFNSDRYDDGTPGPSQTFDTWKIGGAAFWRNQAEGAIGGELWYQSLDIGASIDGFGIAGRGELYLSPTITLAGRVGYSSFDESGVDIDEWAFSAQGRYYLQPNLGLTLGLNYSSFDLGSGGEGFDEWTLRGEAEYLFPECDTSIYGSLMFGDLDPDTGGSSDEWGLGLGLRVYLGTAGSPLEHRHRSGPLETIQTPRFVF
jgi:hypothetical protein